MLEIFRALFLIVVAVSVGRFLAAHLHLIHQSQEIMTHNRVVTAVIAIWVPSVDSSTTTLLGPLFSQKGVFWCYKRISMSPFWFIPRSVKPFNGTRITFSSCIHSLKLTLVRRLIFRFLLTESAIILFYVYAIFNFWVCYFPFFYLCGCYFTQWVEYRSKKLYSVLVTGISWLILNLVIYCQKTRQIRRIIGDLLW